MAVGLKSTAQKAGFEQGYKVTAVEVAADQPAKQWLYILAYLLLAAVYGLQRLRREDPITPAAPSPLEARKHA